jgi:hypothetical protein
LPSEVLIWSVLIIGAVAGTAASQFSRELPFWPALAAAAFGALALTFMLLFFAPLFSEGETSRMRWAWMITLGVIVTLFERKALIPPDGRIAWTGILVVLGVGFLIMMARGGDLPDDVWRDFGVGIAVAAARDELVFRGALPVLSDRFVTVKAEHQFPYRFGPMAWVLALVYGLFEGIQIIGSDISFLFLPFIYGILAGLILALVRAMTGTVLAPLALHVGVGLLILGAGS